MYFGWSEDWIDDRGLPKVGETFIKLFVYRYFELPEDVDDDDRAIVMIFIKCRLCGWLQEHYTTEMEEDIQDYIYNEDATYTCLAEVRCDRCGLQWNHQLEQLRWHDYQLLQAFYQTITPQFDSPIEQIFWEHWKAESCIPLIPQFWIGGYRVDFAHVTTKTVVELDGKRYHSTPYQIANDKRRQTELEQQGWRFIRFTGEEIYSDTEGCIVETLQFLSK